MEILSLAQSSRSHGQIESQFFIGSFSDYFKMLTTGVAIGVVAYNFHKLLEYLANVSRGV